MNRITPIDENNPQAELIQSLRTFVCTFDTDKQAAESLGISAGMISSMQRGNKRIPKRIAERLGFVEAWIRKE